MICFKCGCNLEHCRSVKVGRNDDCPQCRSSIRCCRNCDFYDPASHWECREEISERVSEKENANFCDFFRLSSKTGGKETESKKESLMSAAEALFKKK